MNEVRFSRNEGWESSGPTKHPTQWLKIESLSSSRMLVDSFARTFNMAAVVDNLQKSRCFNKTEFYFSLTHFRWLPTPPEIMPLRYAPWYSCGREKQDWRKHDGVLISLAHRWHVSLLKQSNSISFLKFHTRVQCILTTPTPHYLLPCPLIHLPPNVMSSSLLFL